ncbi:hypothetical protein SS50377_27257 [Spironucleus salmonicida]|uniref:Uncharacterized protein n=1 Tax=Spironucleus salmonicida TaxID=348837 RepID=V6LIZ7_9EUKA|nr:hypothetical protein SS50377_27257 [Spironucleus salmonicida]|eukprot:EST44313.1 Hypothetical protein SS50377_15849 [Spironucleus salmonicida]
MKSPRKLQKHNKQDHLSTPSTLTTNFQEKAKPKFNKLFAENNSILLNSLISSQPKSDDFSLILENQSQLDDNLNALNKHIKAKISKLSLDFSQQISQLLDVNQLNQLTVLKELETVKIEVNNFKNQISNTALRTIIDNLASQLNNSNKRIKNIQEEMLDVKNELKQQQLESAQLYILINQINKNVGQVKLGVEEMRSEVYQSRACQEETDDEIVFGIYPEDQ